MKLGELLLELREGILNDRTDRVDGTSDYLWTDAQLVRYIDEAQRRFAVQGFVLRDGSTPEVTEITLVEGQSEYPMHESVLAVITARLSTRELDLPRVGHAVLAGYRLPTPVRYDPTPFSSLPSGLPAAFSTDERLDADDSGSLSRVTLRVYPVPDATADGQVVKTRVVRKPLDTLRVDDLHATPEIPADHHIEMLDWAAYLALRVVDDDAGNPKRAGEFAQSFEMHVNNARRVAMRKLFAPMPMAVGRNGWSWES